jgi:hypothetical protein
MSRFRTVMGDRAGTVSKLRGTGRSPTITRRLLSWGRYRPTGSSSPNRPSCTCRVSKCHTCGNVSETEEEGRPSRLCLDD